MDANELLDRISVRTKLDQFAFTWKKKGATEPERAAALTDLLATLDAARRVAHVPLGASKAQPTPKPRAQTTAEEEERVVVRLAGGQKVEDFNPDFSLETDEALHDPTPDLEEDPNDKSIVPTAADAKRADDLVLRDLPVGARLAGAIKKYIVPRWNKGHRHFGLPEQFAGRPLPTNHKKWEDALKAAGLQFSSIDWTYDQRNWPAGVLQPGQVPMKIM